MFTFVYDFASKCACGAVVTIHWTIGALSGSYSSDTTLLFEQIYCVSEIASDEMSSSNHKLSHNGDYLLLLDLCYSLLLLDNHSPIESTG